MFLCTPKYLLLVFFTNLDNCIAICLTQKKYWKYQFMKIITYRRLPLNFEKLYCACAVLDRNKNKPFYKIEINALNSLRRISIDVFTIYSVNV